VKYSSLYVLMVPTVEARCQMIAATAREMQDKLRMVLQTNLIRVPKKLKRMEIKDFVAEYGLLPDISCGSSAMDSENADPGYPQTALKGAFGTSLFSRCCSHFLAYNISRGFQKESISKTTFPDSLYVVQVRRPWHLRYREQRTRQRRHVRLARRVQAWRLRRTLLAQTMRS